jgi:hypothetical protein
LTSHSQGARNEGRRNRSSALGKAFRSGGTEIRIRLPPAASQVRTRHRGDRESRTGRASSRRGNTVFVASLPPPAKKSPPEAGALEGVGNARKQALFTK